MSGKNPPKPPGKPGAAAEEADPSMEDILASIRRILNDGDTEEEEEAAPAPAAATGAKPGAPAAAPTPADAAVPASPAAPAAGAKPAPGPQKPAEPAKPAQPAQAAKKPAEEPEDILILDDAMMIAENDAPKAEAGAETLVDATTAAATSSSVGALKKALAERATAVNRGSSGPSIEDIIRDEFRPLLKAWLDTHLAAIVERLVRSEIERVVTRELT